MDDLQEPIRETKIVETFLSKRPGQNSLVVALSTIMACFPASKLYWSGTQWATLLPTSQASVYGDGQVGNFFPRFLSMRTCFTCS